MFHAYLVSENMFHREVMASFLAQRGKGLHFIATPEHGKSSYITNYICTSLSAERSALCNKIIFYHMCSLDDTTKSSSFLFIKHFSISITSLYPDVGHEIFFKQNVQHFFQKEICLLDINLCAENLILAPLKRLSRKNPRRKYIILADFLDDCFVSGKEMNIIQILRNLIRDLPEQFKFLFISRQQKYKFKDLDISSLDTLAMIQTGGYIREVCVLGMY